jgi:hypothetical protein
MSALGADAYSLGPTTNPITGCNARNANGSTQLELIPLKYMSVPPSQDWKPWKVSHHGVVIQSNGPYEVDSLSPCAKIETYEYFRINSKAVGIVVKAPGDHVNSVLALGTAVLLSASFS